MSELRKPLEIWTRRLPESYGKKEGDFCTVRIEIFPAHYWGRHWEPGSELFSPKLPLQGKARKDYWETRFRIRVNGKWSGTRAKYVTYTKEQIRERFFK